MCVILKNRTKEKLQNGEVVVGNFTSFISPEIVEIIGNVGFDFVVLDAEHGPMGPESCMNLTRAAEVSNTTPIVRVPKNETETILRYMDTGIQGIHVPQMNTAEDARACVKAVKYYPEGDRGLSRTRAGDFGVKMSLPEFLDYSNRESLTIVHIENMEGVNNLPEILEVDGIDVIYIGPVDLSGSLGCPCKMDDPRLKEAIDRIIKLTVESDKYLGIYVGDVETAKKYIDRGAQYIATSIYGFIIPPMQDFVKRLK
ncbi:MAG: 4-hydroxy-2-oxovalerate aldolase [FCB group bacterium]|nr:4-hydroxy-2-oxovalerate aldolase [FCB group bacterium]